MRFTYEDYRAIEKWLKLNSVKDTDLPIACPLEGNELIAIVQNNKNKKLQLSEITKLAKNAYELAIQQGFIGTLEDWLKSLRGDSYLLSFDINGGMHLLMYSIQETKVEFKINNEGHLLYK